MDTKDCTILKTLAEENNITYAARRLFMTQPALSERIKKLEKEFNCPIINRQARGVEFTYQGQRLVRYAEDLLNSYTTVRQELLAMGTEPFCFFNKTPCTIEDLPHLPYIHYQTDPNLQQTIDDWWYSHYSQPPMRTIEVNDIDTCMKLVNQGLGFTILTKSCGNDYPTLYKETLKSLDNHIMTRDTWMYTRHSALESKPVQAFYSFMKSWANTRN